MINHSAKSPQRRHKDMSPGARQQLLCAFGDDLQARAEAAAFGSAVSCWIRKTVRRCQADKNRQSLRHTCEKLQRGHTFQWRQRRSLLTSSFTRNNGHPVSDALHKSNRLPVCLHGRGGGLKQQYLSPPAVPSSPLCLSVAAVNLGFPTFFFNSAPSLSSS